MVTRREVAGIDFGDRAPRRGCGGTVAAVVAAGGVNVVGVAGSGGRSGKDDEAEGFGRHGLGGVTHLQFERSIDGLRGRSDDDSRSGIKQQSLRQGPGNKTPTNEGQVRFCPVGMRENERTLAPSTFEASPFTTLR